ncbi:hypothetical protein D3C80_1634630 [compost metagenome]
MKRLKWSTSQTSKAQPGGLGLRRHRCADSRKERRFSRQVNASWSRSSRKVCRISRTVQASRTRTNPRPITMLSASIDFHKPDCVISPMCSTGIRVETANRRITAFATSSR